MTGTSLTLLLLGVAIFLDAGLIVFLSIKVFGRCEVRNSRVGYDHVLPSERLKNKGVK